MSRNRQQDLAGGEDSLLDVIANLVGVLIILVAIASACSHTALIRNSEVVQESESALAAAEEELETETDRAAKVREGFLDIEDRLGRIRQATQMLESTRNQLLVEQELIRRKMAEESVQSNPLASEIVDARMNLDRMKSQLTRLEQRRSATAIVDKDRKQIVHYPAPIAKTVFSDEIHFRLSGGRIEFVPLDELLDQMKARWQNELTPIQAGHLITATAGPVAGFVMEYSLNAQVVGSSSSGSQQVQVELQNFSVVPETSITGEPVATAVMADSRFFTRLQRLKPERTTVSIWVYPDSFAEYQLLREHLRQRGFQTAAWPIEFGQQISGGPNGMRTNAQ